jgi:hypothetical protein
MRIPPPLLIYFLFYILFRIKHISQRCFNGLSIRNAVLLLQLCAVPLLLAALGKRRTSSSIKDMLEEVCGLLQAFCKNVM